MSVRDIYHEAVKQALLKAGLDITHDPLTLQWAGCNLFIDLGAEALLGAERGEQKIAVEIKSFLSDSVLADLHNAVGQYMVYEDILDEVEPERVLYLAVPKASYAAIFDAGRIGEVSLGK